MFNERFDDGMITLELRGMQHALKQHIHAQMLQSSERIQVAIDSVVAKANVAELMEQEIERALREQIAGVCRKLVRDAVEKASEEAQAKLSSVAYERLREALEKGIVA